MYFHPNAATRFSGTAFRSRRYPPGGGYIVAPSAIGSGLGWSLGECPHGTCVPVPPILTAAQVARASAANPRFDAQLGWGRLRDQIEVNFLGCGRAAARLAADAFAQAVASFQRGELLVVDGILGPTTWQRMKAIRAERDPFPRIALTQDFDPTPNAAACEAHNHPAIDIAVAAGTPIPVVADGIVSYAGPVGRIETCANAIACQNGVGPAATCRLVSYGRVVLVKHPDRGPGMQPGGESVYTIYAHVQFTAAHGVVSGERVRAGRLIAEVGQNCVGFSGGPHLHYVVASGPRNRRLTAGGPARCEICGNAYCAANNCPRCDFNHFWNQVTPQRPRTTAAGTAFCW